MFLHSPHYTIRFLKTDALYQIRIELTIFATLTFQREKGRDLTQSNDKSPDTDRKNKKKQRDNNNKNTPPKLRLEDDCGPP